MTDQEKHDMVNYRIQRANDTIKEVEILIENQLWTTSINRLYYACFYAVSALLLKHDIKAESHWNQTDVWTSFCKDRNYIQRPGKILY